MSRLNLNITEECIIIIIKICARQNLELQSRFHNNKTIPECSHKFHLTQLQNCQQFLLLYLSRYFIWTQQTFERISGNDAWLQITQTFIIKICTSFSMYDNAERQKLKLARAYKKLTTSGLQFAKLKPDVSMAGYSRGFTCECKQQLVEYVISGADFSRDLLKSFYLLPNVDYSLLESRQGDNWDRFAVCLSC